ATLVVLAELELLLRRFLDQDALFDERLELVVTELTLLGDELGRAHAALLQVAIPEREAPEDLDLVARDRVAVHLGDDPVVVARFVVLGEGPLRGQPRSQRNTQNMAAQGHIPRGRSLPTGRL